MVSDYRGAVHLSEEAEALLLRYLNEFYSVQPDTAEQQPRASMLFRSGTEPDPGIPLTAVFKREYVRIARAPLPKAAPPTEACLPLSTQGHREILGPHEIVTGGPRPRRACGPGKSPAAQTVP